MINILICLAATVELYEGKVQTNSTIWSSLDALPVPLIEKQSYILPSTVETMRETITERGITNKHVLSKSNCVRFKCLFSTN